MRNFKFILVLLSITLIFSFIGCGSKPADAAEKYFSDVQSGDKSLETMLSEISNIEMDKIESKDISRNDIDQFNKKAAAKFSDNFKSIVYKVNDTKADSDTATINVTIIGPDFSKVYNNLFVQTIKYIAQQRNLNKEMSESDIDNYVDDLFSHNVGDLSNSERTADIHLVKEKDKWTVKVDEDLLKVLLGIDVTVFEELKMN